MGLFYKCSYVVLLSMIETRMASTTLLPKDGCCNLSSHGGCVGLTIDDGNEEDCRHTRTGL